MNGSDNPWERVFELAVEFHSRGQFAEAGSLFVAFLEHNPAHSPSLQRLAAIRRHQRRPDESVELLKQAAVSNPGSADIHNSLGNTLNALGRSEDAIAEYQCALEWRPNFPEAHLNLGNSFKAMRRDAEAAAAYQAAIALRPDYVDAYTSLGIVLERLNRPEEALASFSAALQLNPQVKLGYNNLGKALSALNRHDDALAFLRKAREAEPEAPEPAFNEAIVRLAMGDYKRGLREYEVRLRLPELKMTRSFAQPVWDGTASLAGKTILLQAEQGLGDTILFARYVEAVAKTGARVLLEAQPQLVTLMNSLPGVAQVITAADPLPEFDLHAPFASLPLLFHTTPSKIPARSGYLKAPELPLPATSIPSVGVCWAGNPNYAADYKRSVPLTTFSRLFQSPGVNFISMQQNLRPGDDSILAGFNNIDLKSALQWKGLEQTAAVIAKLDLVITVDTVIAHLAGALGRPVWILLPFSSYWVWGRQREDSDWYASARLFRQAVAGGWESVLDRVLAALGDHLPPVP